MADVVEIFECEGSFSFLQGQHHFTFYVHADSSVRVDLKPVNVATNDSESTEDASVDSPIEENSNEQDNTGNNTTEQGQEEQEAEETAKLLVYDGRAMVELQSEEEQRAQPVCYVVHFKIVQYGRGAQGMWSQIVKCIAHLSPEFGMSGRFVEIREIVEDAQEFVLRLVNHRVESLENALHPLTPGNYELQGVTIAENAFVYECAVSLKLQANGMVSGTSRELPFSQECPLAGAWTRSGLNYLLQYEMHGNKHTYLYFGTPFRSGLQGTWQNSELRNFSGNLDPRTGQAERGCLEFQLVKATRVWSEKFHKDYPAAFRECIKLILLASHRNGLLPSHLWRSIVSYCGYNWFHADKQKALQSDEVKDSISDTVDVP